MEWVLPLLENAPLKQDVTQLDIKRGQVTRRIYFETRPQQITIQEDVANKILYYRLGGYQQGNTSSKKEAAEKIANFLYKHRKTSKTLWLQAGVEDYEKSGDAIEDVAFGGPIVAVDYDSPAWNIFKDHAGINFIQLLLLKDNSS